MAWNSLPGFILDPTNSTDCLGVYLKRTCSRDTSASSALGVLITIMRYTSSWTHSLTRHQKWSNYGHRSHAQRIFVKSGHVFKKISPPLVPVLVRLAEYKRSFSVCVRVCPRAYLRNYTSDLHQIFVLVTYGRDSILLCMAALRYVMYFWFCGWRHICTS